MRLRKTSGGDKKAPKVTSPSVDSVMPGDPATPQTKTLLSEVLRIDEELTSQLALSANADAPLGQLRPVMLLLEFSCHGIPWIIYALLYFICSHRARDVEVSLNLLLALFFDLVIVGGLKAVFRRRRPRHNVMDMVAAPSVDRFSFPSGHTTRAAFMSLLLCTHLITTPVYRLLTYFWASCVAVSRVLLGRHHVVDVLCGVLVGVASYYVYEMMWISEKDCLYYLDTYFSHVHM